MANIAEAFYRQQKTADVFYAMQKHLRRVAFVQRCAGAPLILPNYTDAVHAYNCAMTYVTLCTVHHHTPNAKIIIVLLTHDNLEAFTGDLLAPVKDAISDKWDEVERQVQNRAADLAHIPIGSYEVFTQLFPRDEQMLGVLTTEEIFLVKIIDMYEFLVRMIEERSMGNKDRWVAQSICYGTRSLRERIHKLLEMQNATLEKEYADDIFTAYSAMITIHDLWSVVDYEEEC